jgi:methylated-DNA-protein-cysteine methyltransferase-like protein
MVREMPTEPRVVSEGFNERVYALVRQIPCGRVATYGQIAAALGSARVARHVGFAMAAAGRALLPLPWHRVVNAEGRIAHNGDYARVRQQSDLLRAEGVEIDGAGRIDLNRFRHGF